MKTLLSIVSLVISPVYMIAQPATANGSLSPALHASEYNMTEKTAQNKLTERQFIHKATGTLGMQYTRYTDSSFIYTEYGTNGKELRKGMLAQNNSKAMHYKITKPDLVKDPELKLGLVKDSIIYDEYFDRHGTWIETTADGKTWEGNYEHEMKTGIWKRVDHNAAAGNQIDSMVYYQNNQPVNNGHSFSSANDLFQILKGSWVGDRDMSGRTYQVFRRQPTLSLVTADLKFNSPEELELISKEGSDKLPWSFVNNQLIIGKGDRVSKMAVEYIDVNTLIVHLLPG